MSGKPGPGRGPAGRGRGGMDLTTGRVSTVLLIFSLPIVLQMSIQPVFAFIDLMFIAQISPRAVEAVVERILALLDRDAPAVVKSSRRIVAKGA